MRNNIVKSDPGSDSRDSNCLSAPCGESARRFSVGGFTRLIPKGAEGRSLGGGGVSALSRKEPRGEALAEAEESYSQAEKIVILIANPGITTCRNS
jgi:hypothetical protein